MREVGCKRRRGASRPAAVCRWVAASRSRPQLTPSLSLLIDLRRTTSRQDGKIDSGEGAVPTHIFRLLLLLLLLGGSLLLLLVVRLVRGLLLGVDGLLLGGGAACREVAWGKRASETRMRAGQSGLERRAGQGGRAARRKRTDRRPSLSSPASLLAERTRA